MIVKLQTSRRSVSYSSDYVICCAHPDVLRLGVPDGRVGEHRRREGAQPRGVAQPPPRRGHGLAPEPARVLGPDLQHDQGLVVAETRRVTRVLQKGPSEGS